MNKKGGFTIIEILISVGLAILVIGGSAYFYTTLNTVNAPQEEGIATSTDNIAPPPENETEMGEEASAEPPSDAQEAPKVTAPAPPPPPPPVDPLPPPPVEPPPPPPPPPEPIVKQFTIEADDRDATPSEISVNAGDTVEITFMVKKTNVYFGGLDFRGGPVDTGTIDPGKSKTISFTASETFKIIPYWPSSGTKKSYRITVTVE